MTLDIFGIDYSMVSPAITHFSGKEFKIENCKFYYLTEKVSLAKTFGICKGSHNPKNWNSDEERFERIASWALDIITSKHVALEGYAFGAKGKVFGIAECCGLLKHKLYKENKPFLIYPPTEIKKFATGKGNASKDEMYAAFVAETNLSLLELFSMNKLNSPLTDIVDSYYIAKYFFHNRK